MKLFSIIIVQKTYAPSAGYVVVRPTNNYLAPSRDAAIAAACAGLNGFPNNAADLVAHVGEIELQPLFPTLSDSD